MIITSTQTGSNEHLQPEPHLTIEVCNQDYCEAVKQVTGKGYRIDAIDIIKHGYRLQCSFKHRLRQQELL